MPVRQGIQVRAHRRWVAHEGAGPAKRRCRQGSEPPSGGDRTWLGRVSPPGSDRSASHRIFSTDPPGRDPGTPRGVAAGWVKRWRGDEGSSGVPGGWRPLRGLTRQTPGAHVSDGSDGADEVGRTDIAVRHLAWKARESSARRPRPSVVLGRGGALTLVEKAGTATRCSLEVPVFEGARTGSGRDPILCPPSTFRAPGTTFVTGALASVMERRPGRSGKSRGEYRQPTAGQPVDQTRAETDNPTPLGVAGWVAH